jgi:hypothetical protein
MNAKKVLALLIFVTLLSLIVVYIVIPKQQKTELEKYFIKTTSYDAVVNAAVTHDTLLAYKFVNNNPKIPDTSNELRNDKYQSVTIAQWSLDGMPGAKLDEGKLNNLISYITDLKLDEVISSDERESDLSIYGLSKPEVTVSVEAMNALGGKSVYTLLFGKKNDFLGKRFVKYQDKDDIYLVNDLLYSAANKKIKEFRDVTPLNFDLYTTNFVAIELKDEKTDSLIKYELKKDDGKSSWQFVSPLQATAREEAVMEVLRSLSNLEIENIIDNIIGSQEEQKLSKPSLIITLSNTNVPDSKPTKITAAYESLEKGKGIIGISDDPSLYEFPIEKLKNIAVKRDELREAKLFAFDEVALKEVEISEKGKEKIALQRGETTQSWKVNTREGDGTFVLEYIRGIMLLKSDKFTEPGDPNYLKKEPIENPALVLTLTFEDKKVRTFMISELDPVSQLRVCTEKEKGERFYIKEENYKKLQPKVETFYKPTKAEDKKDNAK